MEEQSKNMHNDTQLKSDFMNENTQTCQSQLAGHRVIPYHWKGMNSEQKKDILIKQESQRVEADMIKQHKLDEEKFHAKQLEVNSLISGCF